MAIEAIAAGLNAGGSIPNPADIGVGLSGGIGQGGAETVEFGPAGLEASPRVSAAQPGDCAVGPAEASLRPDTVSELNASPHRSAQSLGRRMFDGLDALQRGDAAWSRVDFGQLAPGNGPSLRVTAAEPGPASMHLRPAPSEARPPAGGSGERSGPGFEAMVDQLRQMSGQVVQVSIVTKTTGSFTGSLNKLLSSG